MIRLALRLAILLLLLPTVVPTLAQAAWTDYPGIVTPPSALITSTYPGEPAEWPGGANTGYYFVDNSVSCTDTSNTRGYPNNPRCTVPSGTIAGHIIFGNGHIQTASLTRTMACSSGSPCFIRSRTSVATDSTSKARIKNTIFTVLGNPAYAIIEHLYFDGTDSGSVEATLDLGCEAGTFGQYITARQNLFIGNGQDQGAGSVISMSGCSSPSGRSGYLVAYDNIIHDVGDNAPTAAQNDFHGAKAGEHADNLWVCNNQIYYMGGDSIQMGTASTDDANRVNTIYICGNTGYENHENFVDVKEADNVFISSNVGHTMVPTATSGGTCAVAHNGTGNIWFINNIFSDCSVGITTTGSLACPTCMYVIGNIIYDMHETPADAGVVCVNSGGSSPIVAVNNTCYDADSGFEMETGTSNTIDGANNIIYNVNASFYHQWIGSSTAASNSDQANCLFDSPSGAARIRWGTSTIYNVAGWQAAFSGKGVGCIEDDPDFVNAATADFNLLAGSPAINAGQVHGVYAYFASTYPTADPINVDINGTTRPQGGTWDIGALEFVQTGTTRYVDLDIGVASCSTYTVATRACGAGSATAYNTQAGGISASAAGDTLYFRADTYTSAMTVNVSGTSGNQIRLAAYPGESAEWSGTFIPFNIDNFDYITFDGLKSLTTTGFCHIYDATGIVMQNMTFNTSTGSGTSAGCKWDNTTFSRFEDNTVIDGNDSLLLQDSSNNNVIEGNTFTTGRHSLISIRCSDNNVVRDNTFDNNIQKAVEIYDCAGVSDAPVLYDSTTRNLFEFNRFVESADPIATGDDNDYNCIQHGAQLTIVRLNVFYNCQGGGIYYQEYATESEYVYDNFAYSNTFHENDCHAIIGDTGTNYGPNYVFSNILYSNTGSGSASPCQNGTNQTRIPSPTEVVLTNNSLVTSDPGFTNAAARDYTLVSSSAQINAGSFLTLTNGTGSSSTSMVVDEAGVFFDGYTITGEVGDLIQLDGQATQVRVTAINIGTNTMTLSAPLTWSDNQGVALAYYGSAPDRGAFEYNAESISGVPGARLRGMRR